MLSYKDKCCLVYDHGLFVELAITLSKEFGRVLYYAPWENGYPKSNALRIGTGIKGIERVPEIWSHLDDIDLFVFPDVYEGALQKRLAETGKRVWGCRMGEELELDRVASKEHCAALGIDIGPWELIVGLDNLRKFLKSNPDQWVKISATRGDMETFHAESYELIEPRLDELEHNLGATKKIIEFIVEANLEPATEIGYDGFTIDGRFAKNAMVGVEVKDKAYASRTMLYRDLPDTLKSVNDKLASTLKEYKYRGFYSSEVRVTPDGKAYLIDPCARCGSPPSELYQMMITNLADILWHGSDGMVIEPEYAKRFGAEVLLLSDWADKNWQQVEFPESIREHVKLRNMTIIEGDYYVIPQWSGMPEIGAVVAMGDTQDEAIEECKRMAGMVEGYSIEKPCEALDQARDELNEYLGEEKPKSKTQRKAEALAKRGAISDKALAKMSAEA
jgi:hypothetical protein